MSVLHPASLLCVVVAYVQIMRVSGLLRRAHPLLVDQSLVIIDDAGTPLVEISSAWPRPFGGQTAGGQPKPFLRPGSVSQLRELESACRVSVL